MASKKISELTEVTSPIASDVLPIVNGGETKKVQLTNVKTVLGVTQAETDIDGLDTRLTTAEEEIDTAQTDITNLKGGWIPITGTFTYASPTTITVASGASNKYSKGDKLKIVQGGSTKYFYIIGVTDTTLTITGGSDYTLTNAIINDAFVSHSNTPIGFPQWFSFTPTFSGITIGNGTTNGRFCIIGNQAHIRAGFTFGAGSSLGGLTILTLPIPIKSTGYHTYGNIGLGGAFNGSDSFPLNITANGQIFYPANVSNVIVNRNIASSLPFTWATGNSFVINAIYEIN